MIILPFVVLAQALQTPMLDIPAPRGIYSPDFSSCSDTDRGQYQAIFQGYLSITKSDFSVSIFKGTWKRVGNDLQLRVTEFMGRELNNEKGKFDNQTFMSGFTMMIHPNGDLTLQPAKGMVMQSGLTFHREPPMKLVDALKETWHMMDGELTKELEFTLPFKLFDQMFDLKQTLKPGLLEIAESDQPIEIRAEAALQMSGLRGDDLVRRAGSLLLSREPTKERSEKIFQNGLARALSDSRHPSSLYYAIAAKKKGVMRSYEFRETLAKCQNPEAVPMLYDLAKTAKSNEVPGILVAMQTLSPADGLKLANQFGASSDPGISFQVLRARAEMESSAKVRDQSVQQLFDLFSSADWMKQCDIAKTLGNAKTPLALRCLKKISGKGSHEAVQQWIELAFDKYTPKAK